VSTPHAQLKALISSTPSPLGYHRSIDGLVERLRRLTLSLSSKSIPMRECFLQELDNAPNDPPLEDGYLSSFIQRIMSDRFAEEGVELFSMSGFTSKMVTTLICSLLGFGLACWIVGFFIGRCVQSRIDDGSDDPFVPVSMKTLIIVKSTSSSS
jgi:hypothetical protein